MGEEDPVIGVPWVIFVVMKGDSPYFIERADIRY
jgi:hypothetical protein